GAAGRGAAGRRRRSPRARAKLTQQEQVSWAALPHREMEKSKMAEAHAKPHHDYHLVAPSPWPAIGAVSAFLAAVGGITWMHHMFAAAPYLFALPLIATAHTILGSR